MRLPDWYVTGAEATWDQIGVLRSTVRRTINEQGYVVACVQGGRYMEHRVVAMVTLGRGLRPDEVVHHKNHRRADNRPENLEVLPDQRSHSQLHAGGGKSREHLLLVKAEMQSLVRSLTAAEAAEKIVELTGGKSVSSNECEESDSNRHALTGRGF